MATSPGGVEATLALADWRRTIAALYADVRRIAGTNGHAGTNGDPGTAGTPGSGGDPGAALALWRETREHLYREHPQSPVPPERRASFRAHHFRHDPSLRFDVAVDAIDSPADQPANDVNVESSAPGWGSLAGPIPFGAAPGTLAISASVADAADPLATMARLAIDLPVSAGGVMAFERFGSVTIPFDDEPRRLDVYWMVGYAGGLFLPFRDTTNGRETYSAGRYLLDAAKSADLGPGRAPNSLILDFNFAFQPSCAFDPQYACPLAPPANRLDRPIRAGERLA
jgi:uncharacterized protein